MSFDRAIDQHAPAGPRLVAVPFLWGEPHSERRGPEKFFLDVIAPCRGDSDETISQRIRSDSATISLAVAMRDVQGHITQNVLGDRVEIVLNAHDERRRAISLSTMMRQRNRQQASGLVFLLVEQASQFPRALELAKQVSRADGEVVLGGDYVRRCLSSSSTMSRELQQALDLNVSLFAGEIGRDFERVLLDAYSGTLSQIYDFSSDISEVPVVAIAPRQTLSADRAHDRSPSIFLKLLRLCARTLVAPREHSRVVAMRVVDPDGDVGESMPSHVVVRMRKAA